MSERYITIDHTADIAIKAFGKTLAEAFENAGYGMFDIISDATLVKPSRSIEIELKADDLELLLVDWLSELLFLCEVEGMLFSEFEVTLSDLTLKGIAKGEPIDRKNHRLRTEIKAVTYHMLEVDEKEHTVQVLFDI